MIDFQNQQKAAVIESLLGGVLVSQAAKAAGVDRVTVWRWRQHDEQFDAAYDAAMLSRIATIEDALYTQAVKGNVGAMCFWLANRCPERWQHISNIRFTGGVEQVIRLEYVNDWRGNGHAEPPPALPSPGAEGSTE